MFTGVFFAFKYGMQFFNFGLGDWGEEKAGLLWQILYYALLLIYIILLFAMSFYTLLITGQVLMAPFNTYLSEKTAELYSGRKTVAIHWFGWQMILDIWYEFKKAVIYLLIMAIQLPLFFIPIFGQSVLSITLTITGMFTLSYDLLDYSMERDHFPMRKRIALLLKNPGIWLTFGGTIYSLFIVPFVNVLLWPYLVIASTMLYEDRLVEKKEIQA
jgi:CysZ protein